ncbi:MAG: hypothetical protein KGZ88_22640 [Methylomicrobium sp.]|nr:hypothetical protein [Methylomicrobium sp.]
MYLIESHYPDLIDIYQVIVYTHRRSKFGTGMPVKVSRKYIHVAIAEHPVASLGTAEI